jgi:hypothetical protein
MESAPVPAAYQTSARAATRMAVAHAARRQTLLELTNRAPIGACA